MWEIEMLSVLNRPLKTCLQTVSVVVSRMDHNYKQFEEFFLTGLNRKNGWKRSHAQMRIKTFIIALTSVVIFFFSLIIFKAHERPEFQTLVSETNKQIYNLKNFKDKLKNANEKRFNAERKHLQLLGFTDNPRLYPKNIWTNTTLPVIVTTLLAKDEQMGIGFAKNAAQMASNHAVLLYNVGLSSAEVQRVSEYCNTSQCQIVPFDITLFPSHIQDDPVKTIKPLVIQDALNRAGAILYLENKFRIASFIDPLTYKKPVGCFITSKHAVTTMTHPNMINFFKTSVDSFLFLPMVDTNRLLLWNTWEVHQQIMLPWIKCVLTPECVYPIGAQSEGCRFNKKPRYRYSGCHAYESSAFNVVLGITYHFDESNYTFPMADTFFVLAKSIENTTLS